MISESTVFVVDDDDALRKSLTRLMESVGFRVEAFASATEFLEGYDPDKPGCLTLDIKMPGMSGLDLQEQLAQQGCLIPVIIISAHGDVETTVRAMKSGAVDFLKKPYKGKVLLERVREALERDASRRRDEARHASAAARLNKLTTREREVMGYLVKGETTKQIAYQLGLSRKTVDVHRGHIMTKLQADSVVDLLHMWPD